MHFQAAKQANAAPSELIPAQCLHFLSTLRALHRGSGYTGRVDTPVNLRNFRAVLFDLDGVLTPTAEVHRHAWQRLFTDYFNELGTGLEYTEDDYFQFLDGKPRYEGVQHVLEAKNITLDWGSPEDSPDINTVSGLGNRKNAVFQKILRSEGVAAYPGSLKLLDWITGTPLRSAVVSSSRNAKQVLKAAGLLDRFEFIVDGQTSDQHDIPGKPAPEMFLYAAKLLGVSPSEAVVIEDAVPGVEAGVAGRFFTIGVDRGAGPNSLRTAGASLVISDLEQLIPQPSTPAEESGPSLE